jgi:hypothetical protein
VLIILLIMSLYNLYLFFLCQLPGRSDNDIKNFWNARKRKLEKRSLSPFPDKMEPDDELNSSQQVEDSQEDEFNIPQLKFRKYPSIFDEINEKLLDFRGSIIGTSHIPMAPLPSPMMLGDYPQIPPPMETQYHGDFMDPDFWLHNSSLDNDDAEANLLDDFMDPCLCIDFSNLEDDVEVGSRLFV